MPDRTEVIERLREQVQAMANHAGLTEDLDAEVKASRHAILLTEAIDLLEAGESRTEYRVEGDVGPTLYYREGDLGRALRQRNLRAGAWKASRPHPAAHRHRDRVGRCRGRHSPAASLARSLVLLSRFAAPRGPGGRREMILAASSDSDGPFYFRVDQLPAILAQRDALWRERLLGDEAREYAGRAAYMDFDPDGAWEALDPALRMTWVGNTAAGLEAALETAAPDGGGE